jgi:hypothetical protein
LRLNAGPLQADDLFNEDEGRRRKAPKLLTEGHEEIELVAREETFD